ncbi:hypothetical protein ACVWZ6_001790 [Bradyrhizobium sp. GM6.1]
MAVNETLQTGHVDQLCCPSPWALLPTLVSVEMIDNRRGKAAASAAEDVVAASDAPRLEERVRDLLERELAALYFADWAAVDPPGEAAAGDAVAGVLFDRLGAASDGAARLRPAVPLVHRNPAPTTQPGTIRVSRRTATGC